MDAPAPLLHIYYRHVPVSAQQLRHPGRDRPAWFNYEASLRNFLSTIREDAQKSRVRITLLYDGTMEDLRRDFAARLVAEAASEMQVTLVRGGSAIQAFNLNLRLVRSTPMAPCDLVYLVENDYLHQPGWVSKLFELYDNVPDVDYASLYDHRDKYEHPYYADLRPRLVATASHHWRTAPSTCGSFVLRRDVFDADEAVIATLPDFQLFSLLVGERRRNLYTPVPGLATHCMAQHLSPAVDWEALSA